MRRLVLVFVLALALWPVTAGAQGNAPTSEEGFQVNIASPITVPSGQTVPSVVVIGDSATIDGVVQHDLVVIDGDARITGTVNGTVTSVNGHIELGPEARVAEDVLLYRSSINRGAESVIGGTVSREQVGFSFGRGFYIWFWVSMTLAVVLAGLLFAAIAGRQLLDATRVIGTRAGQTAISTVLLWVLLPIVAVLAMLTVVGIPFGLGILLLLLPALWFVGYLVTGTALGGLLLRAARRDQKRVAQPYLAAFIGLIVAQLVGLIPWFGGTLVMIAGLVGAGALAYRAWMALRGSAGNTVPRQVTGTTVSPVS